MKKFFHFLLCIFLIGTLFSCKEDISLEKGEKTLEIMIASDLHFLSDTLVSKENELYCKKNLTRDGRFQEKDTEILEALKMKIKEETPDYLVLTGDISFNGEKESHLALENSLEEILSYTQVLVLPGNHDIMMNSHAFLHDEVFSTPSVTPEEFMDIYEKMGYGNALFKDSLTLSYVYPLDSKHWGLLLDTTLNRYNAEYNEQMTSGELFPSTLNWIESVLKEAEEKGIDVLSFSHHNLLTHHPSFEEFYTLRNAEELRNLYKKYHVSLNFSGHLHIQSIKQEDAFYDISSVSLLDYGNRAGILTIYENAYEYHAENVQKDEAFLKDSFQCFYEKYYMQREAKDQRVYGNLGSYVTDFLASVNAYYFDGNYKKIHELLKKNTALVPLLSENEGDYFNVILKVEDQNQFDSIWIKKK